MKTFFCSIVLMLCCSAFADTNIVLNSGSAVQIQPGETVNITCGGSSIVAGCTCEVYKDQGNWAYRIKKNGVLIGDYWGNSSESETGRTCVGRIVNEPLCK